MPDLKHVHSDEAPSFEKFPIGQGVIHNETLYLVQVPLDPDTEEIVGDTTKDQARRTLENIDAVLQAADTSFDNVIKATVYLEDLAEADAFNDVYAEYVSEPYPVRCAIEAADLASDIRVEIDITAAV